MVCLLFTVISEVFRDQPQRLLSSSASADETRTRSIAFCDCGARQRDPVAILQTRQCEPVNASCSWADSGQAPVRAAIVPLMAFADKPHVSGVPIRSAAVADRTTAISQRFLRRCRDRAAHHDVPPVACQARSWPRGAPRKRRTWQTRLASPVAPVARGAARKAG